MKPKVLLFDEPISALDPEMISKVFDVMIELAHSGMTMTCVTPKLGSPPSVADHVVIMGEERIIEENHLEAFFDNPQSDRVRKFLSQVLTHETAAP